MMEEVRTAASESPGDRDPSESCADAVVVNAVDPACVADALEFEGSCTRREEVAEGSRADVEVAPAFAIPDCSPSEAPPC